MSATLGSGSPTSPLPILEGWAEASFVLCIVLPILASIAVAGRFYVRRLQHFRPGVDDWLILAALLVLWIGAIIAGLAIPYGGIGYHIDTIEPERTEYLLKLTFVLRNLYALPLALTKASVCFFLLRLFTIKRWFRIGAYSIIAWSACFVFLNLLGNLLACTPIAANWNFALPGAKCTNVEGVVVAVAVFDVFINLAIVVLPMPIICTLQMSTRDKILLTALLSFSTFDSVAGALRVVTSVGLRFDHDYPFAMRKLWFWSELESGLAICLACLVVMRPLLDKAIRKRKSFHSRSTPSPTSPSFNWAEAEKLRGRSAITTVKATGDAFDVELAKLDKEYDFDDTDSGEGRPPNVRPGGTIVVSREVFVSTENLPDSHKPNV